MKFENVSRVGKLLYESDVLLIEEDEQNFAVMSAGQVRPEDVITVVVNVMDAFGEKRRMYLYNSVTQFFRIHPNLNEEYRIS